jgi:hypothetical protein
MEHTLLPKTESLRYQPRKSEGFKPHVHEWDAVSPEENPNPRCKVCGVDRNTGLTKEQIERAQSAATSAGRFVDDKISDIIRMAISTSAIVLESEGVDYAIITRMRARTLRMLQVEERRT